ncbi:hypothetical protein AXI59_00200 [Bacillus nakamurai]|uniref:Uncharacterized protein n=1 Tax=Bacillus nakamurai TaxID=1793963 RepID=A0A150F6Z3_9BACI|nr:hypothetical protein [Bacillus nakamurai]KXZ17697.1 hypothetical protein AXI58_18315 [Bacillus nakamurai]KXZ24146.1 hypothetical protein AXI59_00200 [Bacillus nakamurai]MED1227593.1 hypothetical protein [Bacillus nakamurai]
MLFIPFIFGLAFVVWGIYRMRTDDGLFGKNRKNKNIFNLLLMGEASGLGQFLGGILFIIIGIVAFIVK